MTNATRLALATLLLGIVPACGGSGGDTIIVQSGTTTSLAIGVVFQQMREIPPLQEIWGADLEGVRLVRLSDAIQPLGNIFGFAWSPDREWLAFVSDREFDDVPAVYVVRTTGPGVPIRVSSLFSSMSSVFYWAPDSSRVAYFAGANSDLFTARPDVTGSEVQVSGTLVGGGLIRDVHWAPDSSRIAYAADQDTLGKIELYTSLPAGGGNVTVSGATFTSVLGGGLIIFAWAPDSSRLAYKADGDTASVFELYTTLPTGPGGAVRVSPPTTVFAGWTHEYQWAPDSSRIAYTINTISPTIYTSPPAASTGNVQVSGVTTVAGDWAWAPNSSRIGFRTTGLVQSVAPTGGAIATVNATLTGGGSVQSFRWAPDSSRIAYRADQDVDEVFEIYTSLPAGGGNVKVSGPAGAGDAALGDWSPDSRWIHYTANPSGSHAQLFVTRPADATAVVQLSSVVAAGIIIPAWTADGSRLIFAAQQEIAGEQELFAGNPSTGGVVKLSGPFLPGQSNVGNFIPR